MPDLLIRDREFKTAKEAIEHILEYTEAIINREKMSVFKRRYFKVLSSELLTFNGDKENLRLLFKALQLLVDTPDTVLFDAALFESRSPILDPIVELTDLSLLIRLSESFDRVAFSWSKTVGLVLFSPWLIPITIKLFNRYVNFNQDKIEIPDALLFGSLFFLVERVGVLPRKITSVMQPVYGKIHSLFIDPALDGFASLSKKVQVGVENLRARFG